MSVVKELGKSTLLYGVASSLAKFTGLILVPIYTRIFSSEEYGTIDLLELSIQMIAIICLFQLESAISRYYFEVKTDAKRKLYISTSLIFVCSTSLIIYLFLFVLTDPLLKIGGVESEMSSIFQLALVKLPLFCLTSILTVVIRFLEKPWSFVLVTLTQLFSTVAISILLVVNLEMGISGVFLGQIVGLVIAISLLIFQCKKYITLKFDKEVLKLLLAYSLPLVPASLGVWLNQYLNRIVILHYFTLDAIGKISVTLKVASIILVLEAAIRMAWGPILWRYFEKENHRDLFVDLAKNVILIFAVIWFCSLIVINLFYDFFVGQEFQGLHSIALIIIFAYLTRTLNQFYFLGPAITKKTKYNSYVFFFSIFLNVIFLLILSPIYGLVGVAISMLLTNLVVFVIGTIISEKLYYIGYNFQYVAGFIIVGTVSLVGFYLNSNILMIVLAFVIPICIYILIKRFRSISY